MRPLTTLQVNSLFNGGGADNQTLELAVALRERSHNSLLAVPGDCRWLQKARDTGVHVLELPSRKEGKFAMVRAVRKVAREHKVQIIHAHQGRDYWPVIFSAGAAVPFVTRHLVTRPRAATRLFLLRFARIVAVSKAVESVVCRELSGPRSRIHQVYCGIDTSAFTPEANSRSLVFRKANGWTAAHTVLGVVGFFNLPDGKGQLEFLEAAGRIAGKFPHARFCVVGSGSLRTVLQEKIKSLQLEECFRIVPFTSDNVAAIGALDVLVHPAVGSEALGLVVVEAMACAKPVIISRLDGLTEIIENGCEGFFVLPRDVKSLADRMTDILTNPNLATAMGSAGRKRVLEAFSREKLGARMEQIYLEALEQHR